MDLIYIGKFFHPVGGRGWGKVVNWGVFNLASWKYHLTRVHEKMAQHPSNFVSILLKSDLDNCILFD